MSVARRLARLEARLAEDLASRPPPALTDAELVPRILAILDGTAPPLDAGEGGLSDEQRRASVLYLLETVRARVRATGDEVRP